MLVLDGVSKTFSYGVLKKQVVFALKDISFQVSEASVVSFVGHNGSGKSTTFKIIMGLVHPDAGKVLFKGKPLSFLQRNSFAYLPEQVVPFLSQSPKEFLRFSCLYRKPELSKKKLEEKIEEALAWASVKEQFQNLPLFLCSKGMRKRVLWAQMFLAEAKVYILDEPFSDLDKGMREKALGWLEQRSSAVRSSFLISTHHKEILLPNSSKTFFMEEGRLR